MKSKPDDGKLRMISTAFPAGADSAAERSLQVRRLREGSPAQQVAAICYRHGRRGIEFLLVQTGGKRWIFPKGGIERGLSQAQTAALEAFEEAGVHGRIEEVPFARYVGRKRQRARPRGEWERTQLSVHAHLCEVLRVGTPLESKRNPQWFSAEKAMRKLRESRSAEDSEELTRVIEGAVSRIRQMAGAPAMWAAAATHARQKDALQSVQFEAGEILPYRRIAEARYLRYVRRVEPTHAVEVASGTPFGRVLRLGPGKE